jgi:hypothetical protein
LVGDDGDNNSAYGYKHNSTLDAKGISPHKTTQGFNPKAKRLMDGVAKNNLLDAGTADSEA